ncbi:MAG: helix-turn-helix domain-containing protein [Candidatus Stygibacter australis]|nr:helix-turn-helix domain-containing protein [Candidatus Stygibacter australis]
MMEKMYSTVEEAMEVLNLKKRTIYKYCHDGTLTYSRPKNMLYITNESIRNFLKNGIQKEKTMLETKSTGKNPEGGQSENLRN